MAFIIGLDFGNWCSYVCYTRDDSPNGGRLTERPKDLLPSNRVNDTGYPSVFFYSKAAASKCSDPARRPPWCGYEAMRRKATPADHRVRSLKQKMGQPLHLDDWDGDANKAITLLIQYLVREANKMLYMEEMATSNQLSLAYPATFNTEQVLFLKKLAEDATLEDGTHVQVVGMIAEPAAGALDYLAEHSNTDHDTTVLTYDLGGGTFDLAIVTAYPKGKKRPDGEVYYYDVEKTGGLADLGGRDFDRRMADLLKKKAPFGARFGEEELMTNAENAKIDLTDNEETEAALIATESKAVEIPVTRDEFEKAVEPLMQRTIEETRRVLDEYAATGKPAPELIVLTGGASQMPIVQRMLEENFPQFRGKVARFRPSKAIAYGAARFGTPVAAESVQMRVRYDIGIVFYHHDTDIQFVDIYVPAGTPLPFASEDHSSQTRSEGQTKSTFDVVEAKDDYADPKNPYTDFGSIVQATLDYGHPVPKETPALTKIEIDRNGFLTVSAKAEELGECKPIHVTCQLKHFTT